MSRHLYCSVSQVPCVGSQRCALNLAGGPRRCTDKPSRLLKPMPNSNNNNEDSKGDVNTNGRHLHNNRVLRTVTKTERSRSFSPEASEAHSSVPCESARNALKRTSFSHLPLKQTQRAVKLARTLPREQIRSLSLDPVTWQSCYKYPFDKAT